MNDAQTDTMRHRGLYTLLPAIVLGMAAFLTQFDVTAVVVAMPFIAADLGFGVAGYAWVMDAYSLGFTGALLAAGALADRHGRRRALLGGNMLFLVASLVGGVATTGPMLFAARAVQGIAAAFVITGGISLIASTYPAPEDRARSFGLMGVISGIAMAMGPTLGGLVAGWLGWRWIFLVNVPLCLATLFAVPRLIAEARDAGGRPLDWIGVALLTLSLGVTVESLLVGRETPLLMLGGLVLGVGVAAVFVSQQRRRKAPIFDPSVFGRPVMIGIVTLLLAVSIGYWAMLVYLPMYLAAVFGWAGPAAGFALLAATLPMLVLSPIGARLVLSWGWRRLFATATVVMLGGDILLAISASGASASSVSDAIVFIGMALIGSGAALAHAQLSGAVVALVPAEQSGMASAVTVVARQAGFAIGIALMGAMLGKSDRAAGYVAPFLVAAIAAAGGLGAAARLLPASRPN